MPSTPRPARLFLRLIFTYLWLESMLTLEADGRPVRERGRENAFQVLPRPVGVCLSGFTPSGRYVPFRFYPVRSGMCLSGGCPVRSVIDHLSTVLCGSGCRHHCLMWTAFTLTEVDRTSAFTSLVGRSVSYCSLVATSSYWVVRYLTTLLRLATTQRPLRGFAELQSSNTSDTTGKG